MIHYRTSTKTITNRVPKRYAIAVVIGVLLGSAYAVAGPTHDSPARQMLQRPSPAQLLLPANSFHVSDDCALGPVGAVAIAPISVTSRYNIEWRPAYASLGVCARAI
jgi:hypothetical protein